MRTHKKVNKNYDKRQKDYSATIARLTSKRQNSYRKPGSKNPRKHGA